MIDIKEAIEYKPSKALEFMVKGLIKHDKRNDFEVDMDTFGRHNTDSKMCYGCAATCVLQEITGINFTEETTNLNNCYRNDLINIHQRKIFEGAIDNARHGLLLRLFEFCKKERYYKEEYYKKWEMQNSNWKKELPKVRKLIKELKSKGL